MFLGCFWAYIRQPHSHIGWVPPMPFASINSTNPRIWRSWKMRFFESAILNFLSRPFWIFFLKKKKIFASFLWKQVKVYWLARMGQNFDQAKRDNTFLPMPNILKGSVCQTRAASDPRLIFIWGKKVSLDFHTSCLPFPSDKISLDLLIFIYVTN